MIKQIVNALKKHPGVNGWLVNEIATTSHQAFYVLQKLETTRIQDTTEYQVTVYHRFTANEKTFLGSSQFAVSRKLSSKELNQRIEDAVFASSFIKNQDFELVEGGKKRSWKQPALETEPFVLLDQIANRFISCSRPHVKFNAMELFLTRTRVRILNSRGVDLTKTLNKIEVEAIPSYDGENQKVELYKHYTYAEVNFDQIREDAEEALRDVTARYNAQTIGEAKKLPVILREENVKEFFESLIEDYSYPSVYRQMTDKKIGDPIQKDVKGDFLTIGLKPACKADAFDRDGVLLQDVVIVEKGVLHDFYGSNQYAQYLKMKPNGQYNLTSVEKGSVSVKSMRKQPHIEIIALSGIQIDMYSGYIGGEVRLGLYFDGKETKPVSGFSFSGNIDQSLSDLLLSKETIKTAGYSGPRYLRLPGMEIL